MSSDVYADSDASERRQTPFLLDVHNEFIDALGEHRALVLEALDTLFGAY